MPQQRIQFSLRSILAFTAVLAFVSAEAVVFPDWVAGLAGVLGTISAAAFTTILLVYGRGSTRVYAIGALFPVGWMLLGDTPSTSFGYFYGLHAGFLSHWAHIGTSNRHAYVFGWLSSVVLGIACVIFQRLIGGPRQTERE